MENFTKHIAHIIQRHQLLPEKGKVIVAVSGGADSVALLCILNRLGYDCHAAHCNFHLRGNESDRDALFVTELCQRMAIPFHRADFHTKSYAREHHISIEMAAREQRYDFFQQLLTDTHACSIAVAHHMNDNAETLLLHLIRGTGLKGLGGMQYRNGPIIRPFLDVSRQDIMDYLSSIKQDYVTDSTNMNTDPIRNKLRWQVLPILREINPSIDTTLNETAFRLAETGRYFADKIQEDISKIISDNQRKQILQIDKQKLLASNYSLLILYHIIAPYGYDGQHAEKILKSIHHTGAIFENSSHELLVDRDSLLIRPKFTDSNSSIVYIESEGCQSWLESTIHTRILPIQSLDAIPKEDYHIALDADLLKFPLTLRRIQEGDRFQPFGMKGSQLVSDYLTNKKVSRFEKSHQYVLCSGNEIVWLVGRRTAHPFAVIQGKTTHVLVVSIEPTMQLTSI